MDLWSNSKQICVKHIELYWRGSQWDVFIRKCKKFTFNIKKYNLYGSFLCVNLNWKWHCHEIAKIMQPYSALMADLAVSCSAAIKPFRLSSHTAATPSIDGGSNGTLVAVPPSTSAYIFLQCRQLIPSLLDIHHSPMLTHSRPLSLFEFPICHIDWY